VLTIFDIVTVAAFLTMAAAYFAWGNGNQKLLLHLLVAALAFAVANQLGNQGFELFATLILLAGIGYAILVFRHASGGHA
jgi:Na+/H+ antiporter NhaD/arsenite permease-like protein